MGVRFSEITAVLALASRAAFVALLAVGCLSTLNHREVPSRPSATTEHLPDAVGRLVFTPRSLDALLLAARSAARRLSAGPDAALSQTLERVVQRLDDLLDGGPSTLDPRPLRSLDPRPPRSLDPRAVNDHPRWARWGLVPDARIEVSLGAVEAPAAGRALARRARGDESVGVADVDASLHLRLHVETGAPAQTMETLGSMLESLGRVEELHGVGQSPKLLFVRVNSGEFVTVRERTPGVVIDVLRPSDKNAATPRLLERAGRKGRSGDDALELSGGFVLRLYVSRLGALETLFGAAILTRRLSDLSVPSALSAWAAGADWVSSCVERWQGASEIAEVVDVRLRFERDAAVTLDLDAALTPMGQSAWLSARSPQPLSLEPGADVAMALGFNFSSTRFDAAVKAGHLGRRTTAASSTLYEDLSQCPLGLPVIAALGTVFVAPPVDRLRPGTLLPHLAAITAGTSARAQLGVVYAPASRDIAPPRLSWTSLYDEESSSPQPGPEETIVTPDRTIHRRREGAGVVEWELVPNSGSTAPLIEQRIALGGPPEVTARRAPPPQAQAWPLAFAFVEVDTLAKSLADPALASTVQTTLEDLRRLVRRATLSYRHGADHHVRARLHLESGPQSPSPR